MSSILLSARSTSARPLWLNAFYAHLLTSIKLCLSAAEERPRAAYFAKLKRTVVCLLPC